MVIAARKITKMVRRLEHLPGADRLKHLRTTRLQEDLIAVPMWIGTATSVAVRRSLRRQSWALDSGAWWEDETGGKEKSPP